MGRGWNYRVVTKPFTGSVPRESLFRLCRVVVPKPFSGGERNFVPGEPIRMKTVKLDKKGKPEKWLIEAMLVTKPETECLKACTVEKTKYDLHEYTRECVEIGRYFVTARFHLKTRSWDSQQGEWYKKEADTNVPYSNTGLRMNSRYDPVYGCSVDVFRFQAQELGGTMYGLAYEETHCDRNHKKYYRYIPVKIFYVIDEKEFHSKKHNFCTRYFVKKPFELQLSKNKRTFCKEETPILDIRHCPDRKHFYISYKRHPKDTDWTHDLKVDGSQWDHMKNNIVDFARWIDKGKYKLRDVVKVKNTTFSKVFDLERTIIYHYHDDGISDGNSITMLLNDTSCSAGKLYEHHTKGRYVKMSWDKQYKAETCFMEHNDFEKLKQKTNEKGMLIWSQ